METNYPQFTKGQKVVNRYRERRVVISQNGCVVTLSDGEWAHPTKIWPVR